MSPLDDVLFAKLREYVPEPVRVAFDAAAAAGVRVGVTTWLDWGLSDGTRWALWAKPGPDDRSAVALTLAGFRREDGSDEYVWQAPVTMRPERRHAVG